MAIHALEGLTPEWFTPAGQEADDKPTRFKVRPLDGAEYGEVMDSIATHGDRVQINSTGRERAIGLCLLDWENFNDSAGAVRFSKVNLRLVPHSVRLEVVSRILEISSLTGEQVKNS